MYFFLYGFGNLIHIQNILQSEKPGELFFAHITFDTNVGLFSLTLINFPTFQIPIEGHTIPF